MLRMRGTVSMPRTRRGEGVERGRGTEDGRTRSSDSFNPQPSGEDRFWIRLSLTVTSGNERLHACGVSLRLNEPRLTAAG